MRAQALPPGRWATMSPGALPHSHSPQFGSLHVGEVVAWEGFYLAHTLLQINKRQNLTQNRYTLTHTDFQLLLKNVKTPQFHRKKSVVSKPRSSETRRTRNSLPAMNAGWAGLCLLRAVIFRPFRRVEHMKQFLKFCSTPKLHYIFCRSDK